MAVTALYPMITGFEVLDKTVSTHNVGKGTIMREPIMVYLLQTDQGWVLIDAGSNPELIRDPDLRARYYGSGQPPDLDPERDLLRQMASIGVRPADVALVVITHLHCDHAGNLRHFIHAPVLVQRAEHAYGYSAAATPQEGYFDIDYRDIGARWQMLDGDHQVTAGLTLLSTPGHTSGHMSVLVDLLEGGPILLAIDAGDLIENLVEEIAPGGHVDLEQALASLRRCKAVALDRGGRLFPGHDPEFWARMRTLPACYR